MDYSLLLGVHRARFTVQVHDPRASSRRSSLVHTNSVVLHRMHTQASSGGLVSTPRIGAQQVISPNPWGSANSSLRSTGSSERSPKSIDTGSMRSARLVLWAHTLPLSAMPHC